MSVGPPSNHPFAEIPSQVESREEDTLFFIKRLFAFLEESINYVATFLFGRVSKKEEESPLDERVGGQARLLNKKESLSLDEIRKALKIKDTNWLNVYNIIDFVMHLEEEHPYLLKLSSNQPDSIPKLKEEIKKDIQKIDAAEEGAKGRHTREKTVLPYFLNQGNHWSLVIVDREKQTVEYYNSYGCETRANRLLKEPLRQLTEEISTPDKPYKIVFQIKKKIQQDSYQCGAWVLYFLKKRLENPDFDFKQLNGKEITQGEGFRNEIVKDIWGLHEKGVAINSIA